MERSEMSRGLDFRIWPVRGNKAGGRRSLARRIDNRYQT